MKPNTRNEKIDLIENCIEIGANLEKVTNEKLECHIGWLDDGESYSPVKISLIINHQTAWFIFDENDTISSDVLKQRINHFVSFDGVYLDLNDLVERAYGGE